MAVSDDFLSYALELLEPLGGVSSRRMFGGAGLYHSERIFAIAHNDVLYFKVDDDSRGDYTAAGSAPFRPYADRDTIMPYYEVPAEVLEDPEMLCAWARRAAEARGKSR